MYIFDKYPEIHEAHLEYEKLSDESYKRDARYYKSADPADKEAWGKALEKVEAFYEPYAKVVYACLMKDKPKLFNVRTKKYEKWDNVILNPPESFSDCEIRILFGLAERQGLYHLHRKYYKG